MADEELGLNTRYPSHGRFTIVLFNTSAFSIPAFRRVTLVNLHSFSLIVGTRHLSMILFPTSILPCMSFEVLIRRKSFNCN